MSASILAADVGGTKTLVGAFRRNGRRLVAERVESYPSREFSSLPDILQTFCADQRGRFTRLAGGVAGPVVGGRSHVVNLRWPVDRRRLRDSLRIPRVGVINDLEATAWGLAELPSSRFENLTPGLRPRAGNSALIAAGTGLGMALLARVDGRFVPCPSEGGHQEFGPRNELEIELLRFLRERHGRVSVERAVSGPAFSAIYQFLLETGRGQESPDIAARIARGDDPNRVISEAGVGGTDPTAAQAVDLLVSLYGSAAGDLALVANAVAGVYVGGGIAPKILPRLRSGDFVRSFQSKGRLTPVLERIPIRVILEPHTALIGAAACAENLPRESSPRKGSAGGSKTGKMKLRGR